MPKPHSHQVEHLRKELRLAMIDLQDAQDCIHDNPVSCQNVKDSCASVENVEMRLARIKPLLYQIASRA